MKKLTLLLVMFAFLANVAMSQSSEVQNASTNNRYTQQYIDEAKSAQKETKIEKAMSNAKIYLQKAKTAIDKASQHEKTMNDAKTWHYYGVIYLKIATYPEFNDLDTEALVKSADAFLKVNELDSEYFMDNQQEIMSYINSIGINYFNQGGRAYEAKEYQKAIDCYKRSYETMTILGQKDNAALLNAVQIAVINANDYNSAVELCEILIGNAYEEPKVYQFMAVAQGELGNDDKMIEYLQIGREKYPDNEDLINEQINAFLKLKRESEIVDQIKEMASTHKDKFQYSYILGDIYRNVESPIYNVDSAIVYYNKVLEIDPNNVDTYFNIGSVYFNKSAELSKAASELGFDNESLKKYDQMLAEAKSYDEKALPYLEKAYELLPSDNAIKQGLKLVYVRLKMMDKAAALDSAE